MSTRRFFGYHRTGLRAIARNGGEVGLQLRLEGTANDTHRVDLKLAGPGAVEGITAQAIRTMHPRPGTTGLRAGELPFIEFHSPALPWSFSLADIVEAAISPFVGLICVPEDGLILNRDALPLPRAIITAADPPLPDPEAFALLAHVEDPQAGSAIGSRAFSRLLSAQKLRPHHEYFALLVPLSEAGRAAGLGEAPRAGMADAWPADAASLDVALPVYAHWTFRTGPSRSAEEMLRDLRAVPPAGTPAAVPVHASTQPLVPGFTGPVERRAVLAASPSSNDPDSAFAAALDAGPRGARLPLPSYAAEHVDDGLASNPQWFTQLNRNAGLRVMAGHGAALARRHQDAIVGFILDDAGAIEQANAVLARAHAAMRASGRIHARLAKPGTTLSALLRMAGPAARRTRIGDESLASRLEGSIEAVLTNGSFRRRLAAGGPLDRDRTADTRNLLDPLDEAAWQVALGPDLAGAVGLGTNFATTLNRGGELHTSGREPDGPEETSVDPRKLIEDLVEGLPQRSRRVDDGAVGFAALGKGLEEFSRRDTRAPKPNRAPISVAEIRVALDPAHTVPPRIADRITGVDLSDPLPSRIVIDEPVWPHPLLELLFAYDPATLSPSLQHLPPDGVMALQLDPAVVDAVMAGANEEVMRELRWRQIPVPHAVSPVRRMYPCPDNGTPPQPDSKPMVGWGDRPIGEGRTNSVGLVVLIRSAIFRRFPDTVVTLSEAVWSQANAPIREVNPNRQHAPMVMGSLGEDLVYLGFAPSRDEMVGDPDPQNNRPGGFLVFEQSEGGLSFGLNASAATGSGASNSWNGLSWLDLATPGITKGALNETRDGLAWAQSSAAMAVILMERPVTLAIHVSDLVEE